MLRHLVEQGLASLVARWMLEGGAEAVFARVEKAGALKPEELAKLRAETIERLRAVQAEGQPYAETVSVAFQEIVGRLPDVLSLVRMGGVTLATVAAKSAEAAAARAQKLADELEKKASAAGTKPHE